VKVGPFSVRPWTGQPPRRPIAPYTSSGEGEKGQHIRRHSVLPVTLNKRGSLQPMKIISRKPEVDIADGLVDVYANFGAALPSRSPLAARMAVRHPLISGLAWQIHLDECDQWGLVHKKGGRTGLAPIDPWQEIDTALEFGLTVLEVAPMRPFDWWLQFLTALSVRHGKNKNLDCLVLRVPDSSSFEQWQQVVDLWCYLSSASVCFPGSCPDSVVQYATQRYPDRIGLRFVEVSAEEILSLDYETELQRLTCGTSGGQELVGRRRPTLRKPGSRQPSPRETAS
jgi:hypothetical protein